VRQEADASRQQLEEQQQAAAETAAQRAQHDLLANYDKKLEEAGLASRLAAAAASNDAAARARLIAEHELRVAQMDARAAVARCTICLLYWYNSAHTDAAEAQDETRPSRMSACSVYSRYWYKYSVNNTDAAEAEGDEAISDERLLADRRLEWDAQRLTAAQLASIRAEWQAEQRLEQAIPALLVQNYLLY
jgi:hypothetical protein